MKKKTFTRILACALAVQMAFASSAPVYAAKLSEARKAVTVGTGTGSETADADASNKPKADGNKLRMWYTSPGSSSSWESTSLVIGNGKTGGILFGQVAKDQIHFNEKTLWRGGPGSMSNYNGGNRTTAVTKEQLNSWREAEDDKSSSVFPHSTRAFSEGWGTGSGMGQYQDFGDLYLDFGAVGMTNDNVTEYVRDLDMRTGISSVNFDYNGVHYEREYFASHPDHVVVLHLTASEQGKLSFTASVSAARGLTTTKTADEGRITLAGKVDNNGLLCEMQTRIVPTGGSMTSNEDGTVTVTDADSVTIIYATDTDYKNDYPAYRTGETAVELHTSLASVVDQAAERSYADLRERHVTDYDELFGRVEIDLGGECAQKPTNEMMADYRAGNKDHVLEEMIYQFGRYLTIASSREGDELPSNLCGIWMIGSAGSYWGADFHFNVNVQMNYWPAYQTNLAECGSVFTDYVESLVEPGRVTAEYSAAMKTDDVENTPIGEGNGFLVNTQNNPFGCTAPFGGQEYGWNVTGSSWALQNVFDQYLFTGDTELLQNTIYPLIKEMVNFWDGFLWWSDYQDRLVVGPSFSAEQGPTVNGSTYDQSLVWEVYDMAIRASEALGVDADKREEWEEKKEQLNPIIIGDEGQIKEWYEETTTGKAQAGDLAEVSIPNFGAGGSANQGSLHRHTSQLIGLYPGTLVNKDNEEWLEAAKKTLEIRNLGGTGWSKAHKINMWARTGDGETTYELISAMVAGNTNGILDNFLDSHPPYQIDGNFGLTAGINETLIQSQLGYTQFLAALPSAWSEGSIEGVVARGNFVIDMAWSNGEADQFVITSRGGGTFTGEYANLASYTVRKADGTVIAAEKLTDDKISFATEKGETYIINFNETSTKLQNKIDEAKAVLAQMDGDLLDTAREVLQSAITEAEQTIAKGESDQYYNQGVKLAEATKTAKEAFELKKAWDEADAVRQTIDSKETWPSYVKAAENLNNQLASARDLLNKKDASVSDLRAANTAVTEAAEKLSGIYDQLTITFTPTSGTVSGGQTVELSSKYTDLEIRYTTDGNDPIWFSDLYETPIPVEGDQLTIKAALFNGTKQMSKTFTESYTVGSRENVAPTATTVNYTNCYNDMSAYNGNKAVDNSNWSRWATNDNTNEAVLELLFDEPVTVDSAYLYQYYYPGKNDIAEFSVEYWDGEQWQAVVSNESMGTSSKSFSFDPITSDKIRLNITKGTNPSIYEFQLYKPLTISEVESDKTKLEETLEAAKKAIDNGEVSKTIQSVQESFNKVYEYAQAVNANEGSSQSTIDKTVEALEVELKKLDQLAGDKTELQKNYDEYSGLNLDDYKDGTAKDDFQTALKEAKAVLDDGDAMQDAVTAANDKLVAAAKALEKKEAAPVDPKPGESGKDDQKKDDTKKDDSKTDGSGKGSGGSSSSGKGSGKNSGSGTAKTSSTTAAGAKTADTQPVALYLSLCAVAVMGAGIVIVRKKKS